jgi:hypothetical protein
MKTSRSRLENTVRHVLRPAILIGYLLVAAACASSGRTVSTFEGPAYQGPGFRNILVIGVADSYNSRATFERTLAKDIASGGASATPYYTLVKMDTPIDRPTIEKLVTEGSYDGVLITRVLNSDVDSSLKVGTSSAKKVRKDGSAANLFRYDYEELNEPVTLTMAMQVVIASDLFSVESREKVWSVESTVANEAGVEVLVVDASRNVAARLRKDGLIPR